MQSSTKRYVIQASIGLLVSAPLLLWAVMEPLAGRFETATLALKSLGQISALAGTVLFSIGITLRTKTSFFGDSVGNTRSKSELAALLLLLAHPFILATALVPESVSTAISLFFPMGDWVLNFGLYALLLLLSYYAIQFCAGKNKYLKATPHALSFVLFLGTLHAFFIPSDLSRNPLLQGYMLTVIFTAFASYVYQIVASKTSQRTVRLQKEKAS